MLSSTLIDEVVEIVPDLLLAHLDRGSTEVTDELHHAGQVTGDRFRAEVF
jgi:hypothetical protein